MSPSIEYFLFYMEKSYFSPKEMLNTPANSWPGFIVGCKSYFFFFSFFFFFVPLSWSLGFDEIVLAVGLGVELAYHWSHH